MSWAMFKRDRQDSAKPQLVLGLLPNIRGKIMTASFSKVYVGWFDDPEYTLEVIVISDLNSFADNRSWCWSCQDKNPRPPPG